MIKNKKQIIEYFKSGIKKTKDFKIGIEHEKFLFNNINNKRIDYSKIKEMFSALLEFGWNPILDCFVFLIPDLKYCIICFLFVMVIKTIAYG